MSLSPPHSVTLRYWVETAYISLSSKSFHRLTAQHHRFFANLLASQNLDGITLNEGLSYTG